MSRKHNTRHDRSKSRYPERLRARGLGQSPRQPSLSSLRGLHARRTNATGTPFPGFDAEAERETAEILADPDTLAALEEAAADVKAGRVSALEAS